MIPLTPRESETLTWVVRGKTDWEIGKIMQISEHGADKHLRALREKLGVSTRAGIVAEAFRRDLAEVKYGR
jgi:LuxR family quorum sensing-dependent transcriptional regulator